MSRVSEMVEAYSDGMSVDEIAAETGYKIATVKRYLVQGGIAHPMCATDRFMAGLMGPVFQGSDSDIAEVMGVPKGRVNRLRQRLQGV